MNQETVEAEVKKYEKGVMKEINAYLDSDTFKEGCIEMAKEEFKSKVVKETFELTFQGKKMLISYAWKDGKYQVVNVENKDGLKMPYWTHFEGVFIVRVDDQNYTIQRMGDILWLEEDNCLR